jgi:hypothetical protein
MGQRPGGDERVGLRMTSRSERLGVLDEKFGEKATRIRYP